MLFNSTGFAVFFPVMFILYWFITSKDLKFQNILLLVSSYFFYAWANWKILPVLILSTLIFYAAGLFIFRTNNQKIKNLYSILGIIFGVAILIYFKYMNFFIEFFHSLFEKFGIITYLYSLHIIIPVGISFYTFRLLVGKRPTICRRWLGRNMETSLPLVGLCHSSVFNRDVYANRWNFFYLFSILRWRNF